MALGSRVPRWTNTGGATSVTAAEQLTPLQRAVRAASRLDDDEDLESLLEAIKDERRRRRQAAAERLPLDVKPQRKRRPAR